MGIYVGDSEIKGIYLGDTPVKEVYLGDTKIRPTILPGLCFTAEQANSTVQLNKNGSPTSVTLETSTNGSTWSDYTFGTVITLANVGDKVYFRNKSETPTGFSKSASNSYRFVMSGLISASGDTNYLLCKNSTDTLTSNYCYYCLFYQCTSLTTAPELPATSLRSHCYEQMFYGCTSLVTAPSIPATSSDTQGSHCSNMFNRCTSLTYLPRLYVTTMRTSIYYAMFRNCSSLKLSTTQTGDYTQPYRIPAEGTGTTASDWGSYMFTSTGGTFTGTPSINTTYYVHKDITIV